MTDTQGFLAADGHQVFWETFGRRDGVPVLWVHGGPGSGTTPGVARRFDLDRNFLVTMDQRGCGRSRPLADGPGADLTCNTTQHLIGDLEALRGLLDVDRWLVVGGSWGSTLALAYAQAHPQRVTGLVLAPVTAGRRRETEWITREMRRVFPREWDAFISLIPELTHDGDPAAGYARLLADPDPAVHEPAAAAWCAWEDTHVSLAPDWSPDPRYDDPGFRQVCARLVTHYWSHGCFLDDAPILERMDRIAAIPGVLVHGRHDVSSPLDTAWDLHRAWPASRLVVLDDTGHGGGSMAEAVRLAVAELSG